MPRGHDKLKFLLPFAILLLGQIALGSKPTDCDKSTFEADLITYTALESGAAGLSVVGMLALSSDKDSPQFKKLQELGKRDPVIRAVADHVEVLKQEMQNRMAVMNGYRDLFEEMNKRYESRFGKNWATAKDEKDWPEVQKRKQTFSNEFDIYAREKGWPSFDDYFVNQSNQSRFDSDYERSIEKTQKWQVPEVRSMNLALTRYSAKYLNAMLWSESLKMYHAMEKAGLPLQTTAQSRREAQANARTKKAAYNKAIGDMTNAAISIAKVAPHSQTARIGGAGLWGVLGTVGLAALGTENAEASLRGCKDKFQLKDSEISELAAHVDASSIPGGLDTKIQCGNMKLLPTALTELKSADGSYSPGVCHILDAQLKEAQSRYNKDFEINLQSCDQSEVKVDGKSIGKFVKVDSKKYYFEVSPQSKGMGAKFQIADAGGLDFDPQAIQCFRKVGSLDQPVAECSANIRNALIMGTQMNVSVPQSRQKLFHAKKTCESMNSTTNAEPLCHFARHTEAIRQGFSFYSMKCATQALGSSAKQKQKSNSSK